MATSYIKPQAPLRQGENYVYPVTTYDQIVMPNGERWNGTFIRATDTEPTDTEIWIDTSDTDSPIELMPKNAIKYLEFSIPADGWTQSGSEYIHTIYKDSITPDMVVIATNLNGASQNSLEAALNWETTSGSLIFSTELAPSSTITGYCVLVEAEVL